MPHQPLSEANSLLLFSRQTQPNPNISSGTCFFASDSQAGSNFIPCGNSAFGYQTCCQAGDNCISAHACFNYRDGITYLAGCTDSSYSSPACPNKGEYGNQQWSGLVQCDSRAGTWTNCQESPGAVNVGNANPDCKCNGEPPLFTAASYLEPIAQLPLATGDTISWYNGHTPPSGLTPTAGPSSTTTTTPSTTATASPSPSTSPPSSSSEPSSTTSQTDSGAPSQTQTITPPADAVPSSSSAPPPSSTTSAPGAGAAESDSSTTSSDGLSTGGKIGVGVGVSAGALILIVLLVFCFMTMRRKRRQAEFYDDSNQPYSIANGDGSHGGNGMGGRSPTYPRTDGGGTAGGGQGQYMPPMSLYPSAMPGSAGRGSEHGGFGAPSAAAAVGAGGVAAAAAGRRSHDGGRRPSWDRYQGQQNQYGDQMLSGGNEGYGHAGYVAPGGSGVAAGAMAPGAGRRSQETGRRPSVDRYQAQQNQYGHEVTPSGEYGYNQAGQAIPTGAGAAAGATATGRKSSDHGRRPSQDNNTRRPNWEPFPPSQQTRQAPPSSFYNRQRQTQWPGPGAGAAATMFKNNSRSARNNESERPANEAVVSPVGSPVENNAMRPPSPSPPSSYDYPQHGTNLYVVNPDPSSRSSAQTGHVGVATRAGGGNAVSAGHGGGSGGKVREEGGVGKRREDLLYQDQYQQYHQQPMTAAQSKRAEWGYGRSRGQEGLYTGPGGGGSGGGGIRLVRKSVPDRTNR